MNANYKPERHSAKCFTWTVSFRYHKTPWGRQHNYPYCLDEETEMKVKGLFEDSTVGEQQSWDRYPGMWSRRKKREIEIEMKIRSAWILFTLHSLPKSHSGCKQSPRQLLLHSFLCSPISDFNEEKKGIKQFYYKINPEFSVFSSELFAKLGNLNTSSNKLHAIHFIAVFITPGYYHWVNLLMPFYKKQPI